ncbi:MAG: hypothetical protein N2041_08190 [Tepidiforma sp.]|nr:hypothetical protein [Tepidiforma sp.]
MVQFQSGSNCMSNSTAVRKGLPVVENQEQVTASTEPLWGAQPTVFWPSVPPPPQAPVPAVVVPPPVNWKFAPAEDQVWTAACMTAWAWAATPGWAPAPLYAQLAEPDIHLKPLVT